MASKKTRLGGQKIVKLSPADVERICSNTEATNAELAEKFGVSVSRIWEVRHGVHVTTLMAPTRKRSTKKS